MAGNHGNGALPLLPVKIEFLLQRPHNLIIHKELQKGGERERKGGEEERRRGKEERVGGWEERERERRGECREERMGGGGGKRRNNTAYKVTQKYLKSSNSIPLA